MHLDFTGKVAIVTGGGSGIGLATVSLLRESGARVHVFDREVDVSKRQSLEHAMQSVAPFDIVIANAGVGSQAALLETTQDLWDATIATNLTGVFYTIQIAAEVMKERRCGAIVITASTNSYDGEPGLTAYNATKAGVLGLMHTAAAELGPYGVRVNAVCPGLIRTPLTGPTFASPGVLKDYFRAVPLGRCGEASEVANVIAFLASDMASYITGAAVLVDGGQMASKFGVWNEEIAAFDNDRWQLK